MMSGRMDDFLSEKAEIAQVFLLREKKRACNQTDYRLLMAERVGFEPTEACTSTDFESVPL